jgi:hypothetical protein
MKAVQKNTSASHTSPTHGHPWSLTKVKPVRKPIRRMNVTTEDLKEPLQQKWRNNGVDGYTDQYGFQIIRTANGQKMFKLYWKETYITQTYSINAAKEISLVLLNDLIHCKQY